jgi:GAF domain-containing protein
MTMLTLPLSLDAAVPGDAGERVAALRAMAVLDTPPEAGFDALTRLAATVCETPIAMVSLVDGPRLWFKSVHGASAGAIDSRRSFCGECADTLKPLEVASARADPRFANCELVRGTLRIQYYAGAPILYRGIAIGTVCVLDRVPRLMPSRSLRALEQMAEVAAAMLRGRIEAFALFSDTNPQRGRADNDSRLMSDSSFG